jgi:hypothetical protein
MVARKDEFVKKNKTMRQKNKGMILAASLVYRFCWLPASDVVVEVFVELDASLEHVKASELVRCMQSLQKLNEDCEKLRTSLKELEEVTLLIAMLLVPHVAKDHLRG